MKKDTKEPLLAPLKLGTQLKMIAQVAKIQTVYDDLLAKFDVLTNEINTYYIHSSLHSNKNRKYYMI